MPQSIKPLERIPGTLFEREELPSTEIVDGCLRSLITAHERLAEVLERVPPGTHGRGILLARAIISCETLLTKLEVARGAQLTHARLQS